MSGLAVDRRADGITVLTFADPDHRNRMDDELTAEWSRALRDLADDGSLRVVVVTGSGSTFCSGADLGDLADLPGADAVAARARLAAFYDAWLAVRGLPVPTIAAMNGHAVGAGLVLALACDLRYACVDARYSLPFVRLGLHPGEGATALVPEAVGLQRARDLLFTGRTLSGRDAVDYGVAVDATAQSDVLPTALAEAERIATAAPVAVRLTKQALAPYRADLTGALRWELLAQSATTATSDFRAGVAAARARIAPVFQGH